MNAYLYEDRFLMYVCMVWSASLSACLDVSVCVYIYIHQQASKHTLMSKKNDAGTGKDTLHKKHRTRKDTLHNKHNSTKIQQTPKNAYSARMI